MPKYNTNDVQKIGENEQYSDEEHFDKEDQTERKNKKTVVFLLRAINCCTLLLFSAETKEVF